MKKHTLRRLTDTQTSWNKLLKHHWMTLEVGSCGYLHVSSKLTRLLEHSKKQWEAFLINVVQTTNCRSHKVGVTRNWTDSDGGGEKETDHDTCTLCGD